MYSLGSNEVLKKPQLTSESGLLGSSRIIASCERRCAIGTNNEPLGISRVSGCHSPLRLTMVCPSNVVGERLTSLARNVSTEAFGSAPAISLKSTP